MKTELQNATQGLINELNTAHERAQAIIDDLSELLNKMITKLEGEKK